MRVFVITLMLLFFCPNISVAENNNSLKKIFKNLKNNRPVKKISSKLRYKKLERECSQVGNNKNAIQSCTRALKYKLSNIDNAILFGHRGLHRLKLRQYASAERDFRKSIKYAPNSGEAHYNLGRVLEATGKYYYALLAYDAAVTYNPNLRTAFERAVTLSSRVDATKPPTENETEELSQITRTQTSNGWCQVWNNRLLIDQEVCTKKSICDPDSGEICTINYTWPSGVKTSIYIAGGFIEEINGVPATQRKIQSDYCGVSSKTGNTFCYSKNKQNKNIQPNIVSAKETNSLPATTSSRSDVITGKCTVPDGSRSMQAYVEKLFAKFENNGRNAWCAFFAAGAWEEARGKGCLRPSTEARLKNKMIKFSCPVGGLN